MRSWVKHVGLSHKRSVLAVDEFFENRFSGHIMKYIISGLVSGLIFYVIASGYLLSPGAFSFLIAHPGAALYALISHAWLWCAIGVCIVAPIAFSFLREEICNSSFNAIHDMVSEACNKQGIFADLQNDYNNGVSLSVLKARGCSMSTLKTLNKRGKPNEKITITDFLEDKVSWRELIAGGYTAIEVLKAGASLEALKNWEQWGYSIEELVQAGFSMTDLRNALSPLHVSLLESGDHIHDLKDRGCSEVEQGYFSADECDQISKLKMNDTGLYTLHLIAQVMLIIYFFNLSWLATGISLCAVFIVFPFVCLLIGYCIEKIIEKVFLGRTTHPQQRLDQPVKQGFLSYLTKLKTLLQVTSLVSIEMVCQSIISVMKFEICVPLEMMIYHMLRCIIHVFELLRTCIHFLVGWPFANYDERHITMLKKDYNCRQEELQRHVKDPLVNERSNLIYSGSSYGRHPIGGWLRIPLMSGLRSHAQAFMKATLRLLLSPILAPLELLRILVSRLLAVCLHSIHTLRPSYLPSPTVLFHQPGNMISVLTFCPTMYKTELEALKALYAGTIKVPELDCNQPVGLRELTLKFRKLSQKHHPDKTKTVTLADQHKIRLINKAKERSTTKLAGDGFGLEQLFRWFSIENFWPQPLFERAESFLDKVYMQSSPHFFARACFYMFTLAMMSCAVLSFASVLVGPAVVSSTIVSMLSSLGALLSFPMNVNLALPLASSMIYLSVFGVSMLLTLMSINYRLSSYGQVPHAKAQSVDESGSWPVVSPALKPIYQQASILRLCDRPPADQTQQLMASTPPLP